MFFYLVPILLAAFVSSQCLSEYCSKRVFLVYLLHLLPAKPENVINSPEL